MTRPVRPRRVVIRAPAKLNLGLAITGRRPDGFHDLLTIMQAIDLSDELDVRHEATGERPAQVDFAELVSGPGADPDDTVIASPDNLAMRALYETAVATDFPGRLSLSLTKRIPAASGMGGASSDAAAGLMAVEALAGRRLPESERLRITLGLGSDVPFFLSGGTALASGRGNVIETLPEVRDTTFLVVFPHLSHRIARKTARLYGALRPMDFGAGADVREQADRIRAGQALDPGLLGNAFSRALDWVVPAIADLRAVLAATTGSDWALSGAGPAHFVVEPDSERAAAHATALRGVLCQAASVFICRPLSGPGSVLVSS